MKGSLGATLAVVLVMGVFGWSAWRVWRHASPLSEEEEVLRFAHWHQQVGLRDAFDLVAREFEARNPGVKIHQLVVPQRTFGTWLRTQLVGEMAPDLIETASYLENSELFGDHFRPLDDWLAEPPEVGASSSEELAGATWREYFTDRLASTFSPTMGGTYFVPVATFTIRLHVNLDLWRSVMGERALPQGYEEFLAVVEEFSSRASAAGLQVQAMAGGLYSAGFVLDRAQMSVLQRSTYELHGYPPPRPDRVTLTSALARGDWSLADGPFRASLEVRSQLARLLPPGYAQIQREDALFNFLQQRTLFYATGSWDAVWLREDAAFPIAVVPLPVPEPDAAVAQGGMWGDIVEFSEATSVGFAVLRTSPRQELARRFLQFLTTPEGARLFAGRSGWLSPVRDVPLAGIDPIYAPVVDGYPRGFRLADLGDEMRRRHIVEEHRLTKEGPDAFVAAVAGAERAVARIDLESVRRGLRASLRLLERRQFETSAEEAAADRLDELMALQQFNAAWVERTLAETAP